MASDYRSRYSNDVTSTSRWNSHNGSHDKLNAKTEALLFTQSLPFAEKLLWKNVGCQLLFTTAAGIDIIHRYTHIQMQYLLIHFPIKLQCSNKPLHPMQFVIIELNVYLSLHSPIQNTNTEAVVLKLLLSQSYSNYSQYSMVILSQTVLKSQFYFSKKGPMLDVTREM